MTLKVDTFEHDIAEEIKRKDASLTEISTAKNDIGNDPSDTVKKPAPVLLIVLVVVFILGLLGMIGLLYFYFTDSLLPPSQASVAVTESNIPKNTKTLGTVSPTLDREIGRYVTGLEKQDAGYILSINDYPSVFAYMVKNEDDYINELAQAVSYVSVGEAPTGHENGEQGNVALASSTSSSTPSTKTVVSTSTKVTTTSGSSTQTTATTTQATSTPAIIPPYYYDVTISNQNMRIWKNGIQTVVYAFVTTNKVAISRTTDGILTLKNAIIR